MWASCRCGRSVPSLLIKVQRPATPQAWGGSSAFQTVLTGTVRIRGDELFISYELVDVQTNSVLPSGEPYRRKLKDLFAVQEELAHAIADRLRLQLSGESAELARRPTDNPEAYRLYILGRREAKNARRPACRRASTITTGDREGPQLRFGLLRDRRLLHPART